VLAFLEGDAAGMQREAESAKGKPDEFVMLETVAEADGQAAEIERGLPPGNRVGASGKV